MRLSYKLSILAGAFVCFGALPTAFAQVPIVWGQNGDCCSTTLYGQETGPYSVTINGVAAQVLCDDLAAQFTPPKTWDAEVATPGAGTKFGSGNVNPLLETGLPAMTTEQAYSAIAYLAEELGTPGTDSGLVNFAIWDIFDYADVHGSDGSGLGATNLATVDALAHTALQNATPANLAGITIYTPVSGPDGTDLSQDQELISLTPTPTPEASASAILATDVLGFVAIVLFFRRRKSQTA